MDAEGFRTVEGRLEAQNRKEDKKGNAPAFTVSAGSLEPESSGGRPIAPLGFQPKLTCTPEPGRAPV